MNQSCFTNPEYWGGFFDPPKQEALFGVHFGGFVQKKIYPHFSANALLGASQKGAKETFGLIGFQNTYLDLATHARYDYKRLFIEFGPEIAYLIDSKWIINGKKEKTNPSLNPFNKKIDFLGNAGIGAWISKTTSLSFRTSKGFINTIQEATLTDENGSPIVTGSFFKNLSYQISVCQMVF